MATTSSSLLLPSVAGATTSPLHRSRSRSGSNNSFSTTSSFHSSPQPTARSHRSHRSHRKSTTSHRSDNNDDSNSKNNFDDTAALQRVYKALRRRMLAMLKRHCHEERANELVEPLTVVVFKAMAARCFAATNPPSVAAVASKAFSSSSFSAAIAAKNLSADADAVALSSIAKVRCAVCTFSLFLHCWMLVLMALEFNSE